MHEIEQFLKEQGISVQKSLGQNFLHCEDVLLDLISSVEKGASHNVLEIGPGLGVITDLLLEKALDVTAVEVADDLYGYLKKKYVDQSLMRLIHGDVLQTDMSLLYGDLEKREVVHDGGREIGDYIVVSNIPYYITGKIIPYFFENQLKPKEMYLMMQKEVAERLIMKDGKSSIPSIALSYFADADILLYVDRDCYYPVPEVDSAILKIALKDEVFEVGDQKQFFKIVRAAFKNKRKQIHNSLASTFQMSKEEVYVWLKESGIEATARAENLRVEDFVLLEKQYKG